MFFYRFIFILSIVFVLQGKVGAWGKTGHRVVGAIAEHYLSKDVRDVTSDLLKGLSLAQVSNWADEIRGDPAWSHAYPWHYLNVPEGKTYAKNPKNPKGDVIQKIQDFSIILGRRDVDLEKRSQALKWLVHLIGDIHQPLHTGYGRDEGGNKIQVSWFGRPTNLHKVWDEDVILLQELSYSEYADFLTVESKPEQRQWQQDIPMQWLKESRALLSKVYKTGDGNLSYAYAGVARDMIEKRLLQAGIRLAAIINRALGRSRGK
jgi:hypothetical protein